MHRLSDRSATDAPAGGMESGREIATSTLPVGRPPAKMVKRQANPLFPPATTTVPHPSRTAMPQQKAWRTAQTQASCGQVRQARGGGGGLKSIGEALFYGFSPAEFWPNGGFPPPGSAAQPPPCPPCLSWSTDQYRAATSPKPIPASPGRLGRQFPTSFFFLISPPPVDAVVLPAHPHPQGLRQLLPGAIMSATLPADLADADWEPQKRGRFFHAGLLRGRTPKRARVAH